MKIERMYARGAEYQRFETLKRNREKRTRQKLAFMEGVQMVEQAIRHNWEFAAMAVGGGYDRESEAGSSLSDGGRHARGPFRPGRELRDYCPCP